jgi:predicted RNase H-like HicB family nuclease
MPPGYNEQRMRTKYTVVLDREVDGRVIASVPGVPGCHAYGKSTAEAVRRVKAALIFYLKETLREGRRIPVQSRPVAVEISLAL